MATLLDAVKTPPAAKIEEFVQQQLSAARRRVRVLDFFLIGLQVLSVALLFLLIGQIVHHYVATPSWLPWVGLSLFALGAGYYVYRQLFHSSRRQINPYFAARQIEKQIENSKDSLVTWVDFEDDAVIAASIKSAIGQKAAKDLKAVDLDRAIENRPIIWWAVVASVFGLANVAMAFLPPTRTALTLEIPEAGDIVVFNNQDVVFQARISGRIPKADDPDAVRLRMWYNPEDPESYEDRPMKVSESNRRQFGVTIPAKQVRTGFQYKVMAGGVETPSYTVTCKVIPEFTGFDVSYEYPAYLKRPEEKTNDPDLLAPFGTIATLTVHTNRDIKHGHIQIDGQVRTLDGYLTEGVPDSIQFKFPVEKEGSYRVWFTTPEGDQNLDPKKFRIGVIDPKPAVRTFDIAYDYPSYLRWKPATVADVKEPQIDAMRGTKVVITAKTNRGIKGATLELEGQPAVAGELITEEPMWVRFVLPPLEKDGIAKLIFTPTTPENPTDPRSIPIHVQIDQTPTVQLEFPKEDEITLPANGTLELKGLATDDFGVDRVALRLKVLGSAEDVELKGKPYRDGMSFLRKEDNSWPTRIEYKDFVKLADLRQEKNPNWRAASGMTIEYWLEAVDNCTIPAPNKGVSKPKRVKIIAAVTKKDEQQKIDNRNEKLNQEKKEHEKRQDAANKQEKRDPNQPPPQGANQEQGAKQDPQQQPPMGNPDQDPMANPMQGGQPQPNPQNNGMNQNPPPNGQQNQPPPDHEQKTQQVEKAVNDSESAKKPGDTKPDTRPDESAKAEPGEGRPAPKEATNPEGPPPAEDRTPKNNPNDMQNGEEKAGTARDGKVDPKKEEKGEAKSEGDPMQGGMDPGDKTEKSETKPKPDGVEGGGDSGSKPESTQPQPQPMPNGDKPQGTEKGTSRPEKDPSAKPTETPQAKPGDSKPEQETTSGQQKPAGDPKEQHPGQEQPQPPGDAGTERPKERPEAGDARPQPKQGPESEPRGGSREKPNEQQPGGEAGQGRSAPKPEEKSEDEQTGEAKGQPGDVTEQNKQLDREMGGKLDREMNSKNPKIDEKTQSDVSRLMRNPETREKMREKLDKLEQNAKDPLSRQKAQQMRQNGEQEAKNYDNEKPNEDNVDKLGKKLKSEDKQERADAEQRLKDWQKNEENKKELEEKVDELKKKDRTAAKDVEEAMKKNEEQVNKNQSKEGQTPKVDEKSMKEMSDKMANGTPQEKQQANQKLEQMMKDPKTRDQAQQMLKDMAKNSKNEKEKQDLDNASQKAEEMAKDNPQQGGKPDPKQMAEAAKKMASNDPKQQQEGQQQMEDMLKDPKTRDQAQQMLKDMAQNAKSEQEKKDLNNASQKADQMAKDMKDKEQKSGASGKPDPKQMAEAAKKMGSNDPKEQAEGQKQMEDMLKDPKTRDQAQQMLKDMANKSSDPKDKQDLNKASQKADEIAKDMNKKEGKEPQGSKPDPKQMAEAAKKMGSNDPKEKAEGQKQMEEMLKDPKTREQAQDMLKEMAKNSKNEQEKKDLDNAAKKADEMAKDMKDKEQKEGSGKPDPKQMAEAAKKMGSNDPKEKAEGQKQFEEMMKDPKTRDQAQETLKEMAKNAKSEQEKKDLDDASKKADEMAKQQNEKAKQEMDEMAKKFDQMDPKAKEEAMKKMAEMMKDPKVRDEAKKKLEEMAKNATPEQKKQLEEITRGMGGAGPDYVSNPLKEDPSHKLKSAELLLDKFKKNLTNDEFIKQLNWTEQEKQDWIKSQEAVIAGLKRQSEKADWEDRNRTIRSPLERGPDSVKLDPKEGNDPLRGGRYAPPPGYADAYKRFTEDVSGVKPSPKP